LPRANTRRNICRGLLLFRRVSQAHGIGMISGSAGLGRRSQLHDGLFYTFWVIVFSAGVSFACV
jgi:hypothetical protein